jgi:hypothetical protein
MGKAAQFTVAKDFSTEGMVRRYIRLFEPVQAEISAKASQVAAGLETLSRAGRRRPLRTDHA